MAQGATPIARLAPYALGGIGLVVLIFAAWQFTGSSGFAFDFAAYDAAARRIVAGDRLYPAGLGAGYDPTSESGGVYLYPPPLAVALTPLSLLSSESAAVAWLWLRVGILIAAIAAMPVPARARWATLGVAGVSFPVFSDLNLGNVSIVLLGLFVVAWRFRERPLGAIALGIAGWLRYSTALAAVPWLIERRWRAVLIAVATAVVVVLATLPAVGVGGWLDYVANVTAIRSLTAGPHNLGLSTTAAALGIPGPTWPWILLQVGIALAAVVWASRSGDGELAAVVAITGTVLFYPFLHTHYLAVLLVPTAFLVGRQQWWALGLPLLGWLPAAVHPLIAIAGVLAPFAARQGRAGGG